jgi:hypothetical protein
MKKTELWKIYCSKNPKFLEIDAQVTFTQKGLVHFFEQTWEIAHSEGIINGKALAEMQSSSTSGTKGSNDLYNDLFKTMFKK